ncbi:hypothetical protein [Agromyces bauzanensis]|uniref:Uncharacterized protein n=1 Tax=Agromyces bauzanensis TaxID=1308924 RepID=A0A917PM90_9MICO|nr:hypothetical protein [Agromyces bauzanensis]GGJ84797.1 hypothetical protein GCM10011372_23890 [Agromyces bauzanensis]
MSADAVPYPVTDEVIAAQWPGDYLWVYPAMVLMLLFVAIGIVWLTVIAAGVLLALAFRRADRSRLPARTETPDAS